MLACVQVMCVCVTMGKIGYAQTNCPKIATGANFRYDTKINLIQITSHTGHTLPVDLQIVFSMYNMRYTIPNAVTP